MTSAAWRPLCVAATLVLSPAAVLAGGTLDWGLEAEAGALRTDNIFRSNGNGQSATGSTAAFELDARSQTRRLDIDLRASFLGRRFDAAGVADEARPNLNGQLLANLVEERLSWVVVDRMGQRSDNLSSGLVATSIENVNVLTTGPDARLPLTNGFALTGRARVGRADFQKSPYDNTRLGAEFGIEHKLPTGARISINASTARTDFDGALPAVDVASVFLGYLSGGERGQLNYRIGTTTMRNGGNSSSGLLADLRASYRLSDRSGLSADIVYRLADSADTFARSADLEPNFELPNSVLALAGGLRESSANVSYNWGGRRTDTQIRAGYFNDDYIDTVPRVTREGYTLDAGAALRTTGRTRLFVEANYRGSRLVSEPSLRESSVRLGLDWTPARTLGFRTTVEQYGSHGGNVPAYTERRYSLTLFWRLHELQGNGGRRLFDAPPARRRTLSGR